jgi:signal peptidase II
VTPNGESPAVRPLPQDDMVRDVSPPARRSWWPFLIAALIIIGDRITKWQVRQHLSQLDSVSVIPSLFRLVHTENPGAAFGFLANGNPILRTFVLIGVAFAVLFFVASTLWSRRSSSSSLWSRFSFALILGGAAGNLYDRIGRGTVTDFLEIYNGDWTFPAFNVADSAITIGATLLIVDLLWPRQKKARISE